MTKLAALAERVDELVVLALGAMPDVLPANAASRPSAAARRSTKTARYLARARPRSCATRRVAVLAHMCPIYAVLAAPLVKPRRVPLLLWYTHWKRTRTLVAAGPRLRPDPLGRPPLGAARRTRDVRAIGHGIDPAEFPPRRAARRRTGRCACSRSAATPARRASARCCARSPLAIERGIDVRLVVRGPVLVPEAQPRAAHARDPSRTASTSATYVDLGDAVPRDELPALLAASDLLVNNMRPGAPDKVVYEAGAACLPVLASNPVFDEFLPAELRFPTDDFAALADRLVALRGAAPGRRRALGQRSTTASPRSTRSQHWADGVMEAVRR